MSWVRRVFSLRYSLASLLGVAFAFVFLLGVREIVLSPFRAEAEIAAQLRNDRGIVHTHSRYPAWIRTLMQDPMEEVIYVVAPIYADERDLHHAVEKIASLRRLGGLELNETFTRDEHLEILSKRLQHLEILNVSDTCISDRGVAAIASIKTLRQLDMSDNYNGALWPAEFNCRMMISDVALSHLSQLENLEELKLRGNRRITNEGMKHVAKLKNLRVLDLADTSVDDRGIQELLGLVHLELVTCWDMSDEVSAELKQHAPNVECIRY